MLKNEKITIAGGGLVGALLALLLGQRGFRVEVYESRVDMRKQDISAGRSINLALADRGIRPLEMAEVMDSVKGFILPMIGRRVHEIGKDSILQPYGQKSSEIVYSVSRAKLNKLLLDEAEKTGNVNFHFEHKISSLNLESKKILFENFNGDLDKNIEVTYELLIGADGAGSIVRQELLKKVGTENKVEWLDHSYKELTIPPTEQGEFRIDAKALHIWPRSDFMLIALPNPDFSFTVTLFMPTKGKISFDQLKTKQSVRDFFAEHFPGLSDLIPDLENDFFKNPTGPLGTVKCFPWIYEDSVCLMGDSAHAIVPFHGQGMNCGFEDCGEFVTLLDKFESWQDVLKSYQNARKANGDAIAELALDNYVVMRASVIDEKFLMKKKIGFELERKFPEKFIPRYSRVMFHHTPYADTLEIGKIQDRILDDLYDKMQTTGTIDFDLASSLIHERLHEYLST